ncbi:ATP-binding protein [Streptosporangium amethystogenes]|uniref:ATP-binding protein n=1 Tax=Streptosporangium amethystogenes TaxID=2002 RepID=UPI00068A63DB|nr:ATP-binding protein [Streptosporangium amethystogenes]
MTATHDGVAPELIDAMVRLRPGGLTWRRTFPGRPVQVPEARRFVRFLLADSPFCQDAEQIVAELAANAVRHTASGGPYGTFVVEVVRRPEVTRVTVYDSGRGSVPAIVHPALLGEDGRGLPLVTALASQVGCRGSQSHGHAVWAQLTAAKFPTSPERS